MSTNTKWYSGIGFAVAATVILIAVGLDLDDLRKLGLVAALGCMFLATVALMSYVENT